MIFKIIKSNKSFRKCIKNFLFQIENFNNEYQMEISTFILSDDKKEIAIAFNSLNTVISRWEFSTQLPISKLTLDFFCIET